MKNCKTSCINVQKGEAVTMDYTRCVDCGNCENVCPKGAISFSKVKSKKSEVESPKTEENMTENNGWRICSYRGQADSKAQNSADASRLNICKEFAAEVYELSALHKQLS